jgi:imidazolonepropionase-like amidohydrolase
MLAGLFLTVVAPGDWLVGPSFSTFQPAHPTEQASSEKGEVLVVKAERLIVRPGDELSNGMLLIEQGVIVAVGQDLPVPEGSRVLEGKVACAGFVDPWSSLGLDPESVADSSTSPSARTVDAFNPWQLPHLRREALQGGVTTARVQAGRAAAFGGIGALVHTDESPQAEVLLEDACISGSVGVSRAGRLPDVFDRVAEVDRLVGALDKGRRYRESQVEFRHELEEWLEKIAEKVAELEKDFKKAKKEREKEEKEAKEKAKEFKEKKYKEDKKPRKPRFDPDDEALARAVDGEIPLVVEAHRASEIRRLLEKTEPFDRLRLVLAGGTEALPFAEELVRREIPVIVWPAPMGQPRADEYQEHDPALAGALARAGITVLIGSGGGADARELRLLAALAVGHGLDPREALEAITITPARVFDLTRRIGTLERGRSGDVLIFDGDPLDTSAALRVVVSAGRVVVE